MDSVQKYLPLLTALGITGCICHAAGLYRYAGDGWLSVMSLADLIAQTWPVIPGLAVGVAGGVCLRSLMGPGKAFAVVVEGQMQSPKKVVRFWANLKSLTAFFVGIGGILFFLPFVMLLEPRWAILSLVTAVVAGTALSFSSSEIPEAERRPAAVAASLCFTFLAVAYSVGLLRGSFPFMDAPNDLIVSAEGARCVSIVSVMSQGVLFTPDHKIVEFVEWDEITRVVQSTSCSPEAASA